MEINEVKFVLKVLIFAQVLGLRNCQVPVLTGLPPFTLIFEGIPSGSLLFTFNASVAIVDEDIVIRTQGSETSDIVYVNQTRGNDIFVQVFTKTVLDRDGYGIPGKGSVDLRFVATDKRGNTVNIIKTVYISDINDNTPQLQNRPYYWHINEHFHHGNETYNKVTTNDLDAGINGTLGIRYKMEPIAGSDSPVLEYRATFIMDATSGVIKLQRALDYETHKIYQFNVTATDENGSGRTSEATILTITVLDVQDTPPFFTGGSYKHSYVTTLTSRGFNIRNYHDMHSLPFLKDVGEVLISSKILMFQNSLVSTVHALDGDTGYTPLNPVEYSILTGPCSGFFSINSRGEIRTTQPIDTNNEAFELSCELTVMAREIDVHPRKQYGSTKTETTVYVVLESQESHHGDCSRGTTLNAYRNIYIAAVIVPILFV